MGYWNALKNFLWPLTARHQNGLVYRWKRVQMDGELGQLDGFISFPREDHRKRYSAAVGPIFYS